MYSFKVHNVVIWWYLHKLQNDYQNKSISVTSHGYNFVFLVMRDFKVSLHKFQVYHTVWLTIVTGLYTTCPELHYLIIGWLFRKSYQPPLPHTITPNPLPLPTTNLASAIRKEESVTSPTAGVDPEGVTLSEITSETNMVAVTYMWIENCKTQRNRTDKGLSNASKLKS